MGDCLVIRAMAETLCEVAGARHVDPNWDNRGRDVQQYELRVKRLDVRFDQQLREIFSAATAHGLWKATAAVHEPAAYWAEGVLAYFDATGQQPAPTDAPHPIRTREALEQYDPALFALVNETMAYDGHMDWRFGRR